MTVLEARDRVGGRCAHAVLAGVDVDLGAEFSHGDGAVLALCADAHVSPRALYSWDEDAPADLRARLSVDGALLDPSGDHAVPRACRALYEELMSDARWSIGTSASADVSFASLARARGLPPAVVGALDAMHAVEYATCLDDLGVVEWRRREEVLSGRSCSTDFSLLGKYTHALGWLARRAVAAGARLRLASAVRCVAALDAEACVLVDGERFDRAIVTVPLGVLQSGEVRLDGVSIAFREAVRAVRFHGASKVIVAIAPAEWARQLPGGQPLVPMVLCAGDAGDFARQIWTRVSEPAGIVIVTGFLAGPRDCAAAEALTTDEAAESLLAQLARVLGCAFPPLRCVDALKIDWRADEWSRGGYSSPTVGAVGAWRRLQRTGSRVLLYAGEAAHERGSTVDSALESGRRAAAELGLALALASGGVHAAASAAPSSI